MPRKSKPAKPVSPALPLPADTQVQIRMPSSVYEVVKHRALLDRRTVSAVLRMMIEDGVKRLGEHP